MVILKIFSPEPLFSLTAHERAPQLSRGDTISKPPPSPYFTIPEVADYLRVSRRTIFTLLRTDALQRTKLVGGRTVIHRTSLEAFVARAGRSQAGARA